jgi:PKD repeat protein
MTYTAREATTNEKAYLRSNGQWSKLYLAFPQYTAIFKADVDQVTIVNDMIVEITYHNITLGAYTDIHPGMTLLVGSAEGARDLGIARIRKAASDSKLYIGETSEVSFIDGAFLTVTNEYGLWPKYQYTASGSTHIDYMDRDVAYTNQHKYLDPVPVLGPDRVVFYPGTLGGANTVSIQFDAADSYCLSEAMTGATYHWPVGDWTIDDDTLVNPVLTFDLPGTYVVSCTVTMAAPNSKVFTGYRTVVIYDDTALPISNFELESCRGSYETGGWEFKVKMHDDAALTSLYDRSKCILFARDWYGDLTTLTSTGISFEAPHKIVKSSGLGIFLKDSTIRVSGSTLNDGIYTITSVASGHIFVVEDIVDEAAGDSVTIEVLDHHVEVGIGQIAGCENILASGWLAEEDLEFDVDGGLASFTVHGPQYWLDAMEGFLSFLRHSETDPTEWALMLDLTQDKGIWDLLHWRCTATAMMDVYLTGSPQLMSTMESSSVGSLWQQAKSMMIQVLAMPCCDKYGRLFTEINGQYIPLEDRAYTNIMTIEAYDRVGEIVLERRAVPAVSQLNLSGVWFNGVTGYTVVALANGHTMKRHGKTEVIERLVIADQTHCTELAGLILAQRNNQYPTMSIELASNMRLIDICPQQQLYVVTNTDMNPRQVTVSNSVFVRDISLRHDKKTSFITTSIQGEPETTVVTASIKGDIPSKPDDPDDPLPPPFEFPEIPPLPDGGIDIPTSRGAEYMMGKTWMSDTINHLGYLQFMKFADPFLHTNNKGLFLTYYNSNYIYIRRRCRGTLTVEFIAHHPSGTSIGGYTIFQAFPDDIFEGMANIYGNYEYSKQHLGENANSRCIVICSFDGYGTFNFSAANYSGGPLQYLSNYWITEI